MQANRLKTTVYTVALTFTQQSFLSWPLLLPIFNFASCVLNIYFPVSICFYFLHKKKFQFAAHVVYYRQVRAARQIFEKNSVVDQGTLTIIILMKMAFLDN